MTDDILVERRGALGLVTLNRPKALNALTLPMWLMSGTFFSWERFPDFLHPVIQALPLTALNDALRAITNHAAGPAEVLPQVAILAAWGLIAFTAGVRLFRWK